MATVIPTTLDVIVLAVQQQLMAWLALPPERCVVTDPGKFTFHHEADSYLWVWPDFEVTNLPVLFGAGRLDARITERIEVGIRSRLATDEATSAALWLTDQVLGHCLTRNAVWDALLQWTPMDLQGNDLTVGPLVPGRGGRPKLGTDEREWGESIIAFDATYILKLTQGIP